MGYRVDLVVEDKILVELKAVDRIEPVMEAQLMTYLRLTELPVGLLINFHVPRLCDGIIRRAMTHRGASVRANGPDTSPPTPERQRSRRAPDPTTPK